MRRDELMMEALILSISCRDQRISPREMATATEHLAAARQLYPSHKISSAAKTPGRQFSKALPPSLMRFVSLSRIPGRMGVIVGGRWSYDLYYLQSSEPTRPRP
jgi:hypothetical protein